MCYDRFSLEEPHSTVEFLTGQLSDIFNLVEVDLFPPSQVIHGGFQVTKKKIKEIKL